MNCKALKRVFRYLSCHEVAQNRLVCKMFYEAGNSFLNKKFAKICEDITFLIMDNYKYHSTFVSNSAKLRKKLLLSTNSILLLLRTVFGRNITSGYCSFYPGLIIDYAENIIYNLKTNGTNTSVQQKLKTLYTCSKSAMEHFEMYIEPDLPGPSTFVGTKILDTLATCCHLQAVETERLQFFKKVCVMFPQDLPVYLKHRQDTTRFCKLRKQVLRYNNSWFSDQLRPCNGDCYIKSRRSARYSSNMSKKKTKVQVESTVEEPDEISKQEQQTNTSIQETTLNIDIAPPDSVVMNNELTEPAIDTKEFMQDRQNETCDKLHSNKRKSVTKHMHAFKKFCNLKPIAEETETNNVSQSPEKLWHPYKSVFTIANNHD